MREHLPTAKAGKAVIDSGRAHYFAVFVTGRRRVEQYVPRKLHFILIL